MKKIDYLNISKYINKASDRQPAYIGHVNYALQNSGGADAFPEIDTYDIEGQSNTKSLSTRLTMVPVVPSKSLYGHEKSLNITNWVGPDFEPASATLALLQEIRNDKKEEFAVPGSLENELNLLIEAQQRYAKNLIEIKNSLEFMITELLERKMAYDTLTNFTWDLSNLIKHIASIQITVGEIESSIADAQDKEAYFQSLA